MWARLHCSRAIEILLDRPALIETTLGEHNFRRVIMRVVAIAGDMLASLAFGEMYRFYEPIEFEIRVCLACACEAITRDNRIWTYPLIKFFPACFPDSGTLYKVPKVPGYCRLSRIDPARISQRGLRFRSEKRSSSSSSSSSARFASETTRTQMYVVHSRCTFLAREIYDPTIIHNVDEENDCRRPLRSL